MGIPPTIAYRKGEIYQRSRDGAKEARGRTGLWLLATNGHVPGADLGRHLSFLRDVLFPPGGDERLDQLRAMMRAKGVTADVMCFRYGRQGAQLPVIPEELRNPFARLPAPIDTDFDTD